MHHVAVPLEGHELVYLLAAVLDNPTDIVTGEIDEHHVLGALFGVLGELAREAPVVLLVAALVGGCRRSAGR